MITNLGEVMNYVAITFLVLVVFFLLCNKKIMSYEEIIRKGNFKQEIENVEKSICYINRKTIKNKEDLIKKIKELNCNHIIFGDIEELNKTEEKTIIANFVFLNKVTCGFEYEFKYMNHSKNIKNLLYKLLAACLNYVEMLSRHNIMDYSILIARKETIEQDIKSNDITSFTLSPFLSKKVEKEDLKEHVVRKHKISIKNLVSIILTIMAGTIVTANVVYNVVNIFKGEGNIYDVVACTIIYICYANITVEIYKPMGIFRFIASYLFPLYIVVFIVFTTYYYIINMISRCKMSNRKNFFISLIILLVVYLIFILLKTYI